MSRPVDAPHLTRKYWPVIDDLATEVLEQTTGRAMRTSALTGVDPITDMLGCGMWGCVYPVTIQRWVVKVTADPFEGRIVRAILEVPDLYLHPGIAAILGIWRLPERSEEGLDLFVIIREDITPINPKAQENATAVKTLHLIRDVAATYNQAVHDHQLATMRQAADYLTSWLYMAPERDPRLTLVADFLMRFWRTFGSPLADVHAGNVGTREHDLGNAMGAHPELGPRRWTDAFVAFDLGHSMFDELYEAPVLPELRVPNIGERS